MAPLPFTSAAILLLLCIPFVAALPPFNCTSNPTLDIAVSPSNSHTRTLWDIVWSCTATLFACTWTAIHPNIPGMNEGRVIIFLRRLFIMILALIAPELMITWAAIQFLSARDAAKAFNVTSDTEFHQACSDNLESTVGLLNNFASDGKINPHPSTPRVSGRHFEGSFPAQYSGVVTDFVQRMQHRMDCNIWFPCVDGWIHAILW
jgi:hypothetical protein